LKFYPVRREARCRRKDDIMWVFDGERWTEDDGGERPANEKKPEPARPRWDEMTPELQVVEIVPVPRKNPIPPFPIP
jgi:hypothetical protein